MKTVTCSLTTLALGLTMALPALAQTMDSSQYDPIMAKRADLRMEYMASRRSDSTPAVRLHRSGDDSMADSFMPDRSRMVDFTALSAKRADLRLRAGQIGAEAAYDEWAGQQAGK